MISSIIDAIQFAKFLSYLPLSLTLKTSIGSRKTFDQEEILSRTRLLWQVKEEEKGRKDRVWLDITYNETL